VRLEREDFLRGVVKMGVMARDFRILEFRLVDLLGDVAVGGGYIGNEEVEAELVGKGKGEGSTCETCNDRILSVDLIPRTVGGWGNGKFDKLCFNVGDELNVVIGIPPCVD